MKWKTLSLNAIVIEIKAKGEFSVVGVLTVGF